MPLKAYNGIAQSRSRTDDLRITNALLYQLSYLGGKRKRALSEQCALELEA